MIFVKMSCLKDWKLEYVGVLVFVGSKDILLFCYVCVEKGVIYNGGLEDSRGYGFFLWYSYFRFILIKENVVKLIVLMWVYRFVM